MLRHPFNEFCRAGNGKFNIGKHNKRRNVKVLVDRAERQLTGEPRNL